MPGSKLFEDMFKSFSDKKADETTPKSYTRSSDLGYSSEPERPSMFSPVVKIVLVLLFVLLGVVLYPRYKEWSSQPTDKSAVPVDSVGQQPILNEQPIVGEQPVRGRMTIVMDDPNEPPYHMLGVVYDNGAKILTFELPDGATEETSDTTLQVAMDVGAGTNLDGRTFRVDINDGERVLSENETNEGKVALGSIEFTKTQESDSGMGQGDQTVRYSFMKNGKCLTFALQLHFGNPQAYDPPVKVFELDKEVENMERILRTIRAAKVDHPNS
jgi:hypothetical protein